MTHHDFFRRLVSRVLVVTSLAFCPIYPPPVQASSTLAIGEVAWAGSSASLADEWIELWNLSDQDLPLTGFQLVGASTAPIFFADDAIIPAQGTYLIANYADSDTHSTLAVVTNAATTTVSLSNSSLQVMLLDASGTEIDRAGDGSAPPAGTSGTLKASMIRSGESWVTASTTSNFDPGSTDLGTPGICDGCQTGLETPTETPPPVEEIGETAEEEAESIQITPEETTTSTENITAWASSTDLLPVPDQALSSSTDSLAVEMVATTSSTETVLENATSTPTEIAPVESSETSSSSTATPASTPAPAASSLGTTVSNPTPSSTTPVVPTYDLIRLNEVMPQPDGEEEWIEVTTLNAGNPTPLQDLQLHDATGKIYTFTTGTLDGATPYIRIFLTSARLNNAGDTVTLQDPHGVILDTLIYESSTKGETWARSPDATGTWQLTATATPNLANSVSAPLVEENAEVTASASSTTPTTDEEAGVEETLETVATSVSDSPPVVSAPVSTATKPKTTDAKKTVVAPKETAKKTVKPTAPKTTKPAAKSTKAAAALPQPLTFDMLQQDTNAGILVSLQGVVASPPGLLTSHAFILLAPDGRGLLVRVPTSRKLPDFNEHITVTGTLVFSDTGIPSLKQNKNDVWTTLPGKGEGNTPRIVDLVAPGNEDAWSLVHVTGTVRSIKGSNVTLDLKDTDITVTIRPVADYRTARLAVGDTISVRGLLDISREELRVLPRSAEDIVLVQHAEIKAAPAAKQVLPGWTPFGAAGIAIAGTEGFKHLREKRKQRALEKMLQTGLNGESV